MVTTVTAAMARLISRRARTLGPDSTGAWAIRRSRLKYMMQFLAPWKVAAAVIVPA
jgi:hypothetical protein